MNVVLLVVVGVVNECENGWRRRREIAKAAQVRYVRVQLHKGAVRQPPKPRKSPGKSPVKSKSRYCTVRIVALGGSWGFLDTVFSPIPAWSAQNQANHSHCGIDSAHAQPHQTPTRGVLYSTDDRRGTWRCTGNLRIASEPFVLFLNRKSPEFLP